MSEQELLEVLMKVVGLVEPLTHEQRMAVFAGLARKFCRVCWCALEEGERCQCAND